MVDQRLDPDSDPLKPGAATRESKRDPVISTVTRYIKEGWPNTISSEEVLHYKRLADSLLMKKGCLPFEPEVQSVLQVKLKHTFGIVYFGVQLFLVLSGYI